MNCRVTIPCLMVFVSALSGQAPAPIFNRSLLVGSWKVNWEKSKMQNAGTSPLPNLYRFYEDHGDGFMLHTVMVVDASQKHAQLMLLAAVKYDDKEYPTFTGERLTSFLATGKTSAETVSFKVVNADTMEWTDRTNGKVTGTGTVALSSDGKTMTDANKAIDADGKQTSSSVLTYQRE
jgi:hypothetical protein